MALTASSLSAAELAALLRDSQHWELLRQRQAKETRRSVYRVNEQVLAKKFEIPRAIRRYRRPWLIEDACLRHLNGDGAPRSFGWHEAIEGDSRVVWLVKEYVPGTHLESFAAGELPAVARLLTRLHSRRVVTNDASPGNFIRTPAGHLRFLDFGRARLFRFPGPLLDLHIGWGLAKLRREGFRWDGALWSAFLPLYFDALDVGPFRRAGLRAACAASIALRMIRKTLQGKSPRS